MERNRLRRLKMVVVLLNTQRTIGLERIFLTNQTNLNLEKQLHNRDVFWVFYTLKVTKWWSIEEL